MHVEAALIDRIGDVGRKLHTAGAATTRWRPTPSSGPATPSTGSTPGSLALQRALLAAAERHRDVILPGYTHMQRAQPVLAAHYFLAYVEKLARDRGRLADCRRG